MSGWRVSAHKSSMFFSSNFSIDRKFELKRISGFEEGAWSCTYLGIPLHVGRMRLRLFDPLIAKIQNK